MNETLIALQTRNADISSQLEEAIRKQNDTRSQLEQINEEAARFNTQLELEKLDTEIDEKRAQLRKTAEELRALNARAQSKRDPRSFKISQRKKMESTIERLEEELAELEQKKGGAAAGLGRGKRQRITGPEAQAHARRDEDEDAEYVLFWGDTDPSKSSNVQVVY